MGKKCCFTGYRPQKLPYLQNQFSEEYQTLYLTLTECIKAAVKLGYDYFISGFAEGVDLMAAEAVLNLKREGYDIKLEAALPAMNQTEHWEDLSRGIYYMLLDQADRRVCVDQTMDPYSCLRRDEYMVKESDLVIAVFDGQKGGTAYTVNYARKKNRNLWIIDPSDFGISKEEGLF
ncbi:MAG: DUF1273 family protein [Firmicutes bacterium]|nr:DUF1273 family protein [Bacillota bacterium]